MRSRQRRSFSHCQTVSGFKCAALLFVAFMLQAMQNEAFAETLFWDARPAVNFIGGSTDSANINGVTINTSGTRAGGFDSEGLNQHEIQPATSLNGYTGFVFSIFNATADDESTSQTTTISFSEPVYNLSFVVGDIDGGATYNDGTNSFTDIVEFRANGGSTLPTSGTPADASKVNWNSSTGRATAISNANGTDATVSITISFAGPVNSLTIRHIGANTDNANPTQQGVFIDDLSFQRSPRIAIRKTSNGGVGTFNFSIANGAFLTGTSITTVTAGTAVTGTQVRLDNNNTATTVTETIPPGWITSSPAVCVDANSANSGNPASFNAVISNGVFTVPAGNIRAGAELTCSFVNIKLPTLQLRKISIGGTRTFDFSATNGYGTASITTTTPGTPVAIAARTLSSFSTATTITETIPANYFISSIVCTGLGSGTATPNLAAGTVALNSSATAPGRVIVCTYTNEVANPVLAIQKTANTAGPVTAGQVITYTYRITNSGNQLISGVTIAETFNGTGTPPVPLNETLVTDNAPGGDSSDSTANNGTWSTLAPGDVITFTAPYTVQQSDIDQLQ